MLRLPHCSTGRVSLSARSLPCRVTPSLVSPTSAACRSSVVRRSAQGPQQQQSTHDSHDVASEDSSVQIDSQSLEERQRSGQECSTSTSTQETHASTASSEQHNSSSDSRDWLATARSLVSSKHDAMIFNLAAPSLLALAADPLLAITDTAFVGQLGNNELAAFSINTSVFTFSFLVFNFLSTATTPAVATALATGDKEKAGKTICQALFLALVLGGSASSILTLQATPVLQVMGVAPSDGDLFDLALKFLFIRATAAPAALLVSVSQGVFRGLQDMRTPLGVTVATNLLHLGLSLGLIFQAHMGLSGAALSISLSEWAAAAAYLALGWSKRSELGLDKLWGASGEAGSSQLQQSKLSSSNGDRANSGSGSSSSGVDVDTNGASSSSSSSSNGVDANGAMSSFDELPSALSIAVREFATSYTPFLKAGGAVLLRTGLLLGTKTLASAVAMRLGPAQMSTHQILYQVWLLASLAVDSLAISGQVAVAVNLGRGDLNGAREISNRLLQLGVGLGGTLAIALFIAEPVWPRTFTQEAGIISAVQSIAPLTLALLPINSVVYVLDGVFVGANDFAFLVRAMLVAAMLGTPLLLAVQPLDLGLEGVWWGLSVLMIGRCVGLLWRYNSPQGPVPPKLVAATAGSAIDVSALPNEDGQGGSIDVIADEDGSKGSQAESRRELLSSSRQDSSRPR